MHRTIHIISIILETLFSDGEPRHSSSLAGDKGAPDGQFSLVKLPFVELLASKGTPKRKRNGSGKGDKLQG